MITRSEVGVQKEIYTYILITRSEVGVQKEIYTYIPVLVSRPADDVSHKPGSRLPLLSPMPTVTLATLKRAATNFAA